MSLPATSQQRESHAVFDFCTSADAGTAGDVLEALADLLIHISPATDPPDDETEKKVDKVPSSV